ncbi:MAG: hypothetical protein U0T82_04295 [Bacteroidales bacterium]
MRRILILCCLLAGTLITGCRSEIKDFRELDRTPVIFPDYGGIVIPPNIAPLNFLIKEEGEEFEVRLSIPSGRKLIMHSHNPKFEFSQGKWHALLKEGRGSSLLVEIFVKNKISGWQKFKTIENKISTDDIDNHLVYRLINTGYVLWNELGIWQRNLENFEETPVIENRAFEYGCLNCHSFRHNDPDYMMLHTRAIHGGTIIGRDGKLIKVDTKTANILSAGVYPSWHPDGNHIAFSVNRINQHFATGDIRIEVTDEVSDLMVYDINKNEISTCPSISGLSRENLPVWSPDGKFLYFISAPPATNLSNRIIGRYDLLRIAFDTLNDSWGKVDTILSSSVTGKSITFPKVSPNGRFIMFCLSDHGYFSIHHPMADLYLMDLQTHSYRKMEINSPETDSYHSFSSKGNWFVFSSKRMDGLFTRPYFSYLDENGNASKPFVLPQKDPEFYNHFIKNYNIPELITGKIKYSPLEIRDKILEDPVKARMSESVDTAYMNEHLFTGN